VRGRRPGAGESIRPYAEMLSCHGYSVLAVDLRGHGGSEGRANRLGWQVALGTSGGRELSRCEFVRAARCGVETAEAVTTMGGNGWSRCHD
jgi:predicted alpha/beta hydrolase